MKAFRMKHHLIIIKISKEKSQTSKISKKNLERAAGQLLLRNRSVIEFHHFSFSDYSFWAVIYCPVGKQNQPQLVLGLSAARIFCCLTSCTTTTMCLYWDWPWFFQLQFCHSYNSVGKWLHFTPFRVEFSNFFLIFRVSQRLYTYI